MSRSRRLGLAVTGGVAIALSVAVPASYLTAASAAAPNHGAPQHTAAAPQAHVTLAYPHLTLPNHEWAAVYSDGIAEVHRTTDNSTEIQHVPLVGNDAISSGVTGPYGDGTRELPAVGDLISDLIHGPAAPYAAQQLIVIYGSGVTAPDHLTANAAAVRNGKVSPSYTSSSTLNHALAGLGVDSESHLFAGAMHAKLTALRAQTQRSVGHSVLDYANAYVLHLTGSSVAKAVTALRSNPDIAFAEPNWTVTTDHTPSLALSKAQIDRALAMSKKLQTPAANRAAKTSGIPDNYALTSSDQSLLNRPAVDVVPAYAQIAAKGQLPGQGETITNVSLGTLTDASTATNPNDPCQFYAQAYGPTTEVINGQRYIDWPSMPLIPTYTASSDGTLDPTGETCGDDPTLTEVGLDFSMMAPLPHDAQRPGHEGAGLTDLLGIAPGANYRLVLPATAGGQVSDVDAAFFAAATQSPRPNVITASLSFGFDAQGFAARYLEDDPLTQAIIMSIVHGYHIVVVESSNDGLREATNAAVSPAGGSVATEVAKPGSDQTNLSDIGNSDAVSRDYDSGAIAAGGSTLDDIFSAPPQDPKNKAQQYIQAYPATRYNGARNYSSGFGSRINVSAPGDNVMSFSHTQGGQAGDVTVVNEGGTSASAPEIAAAAAVVEQAARIAGNTRLATNPLAVRSFLEQSGTVMPQPNQADRELSVGPQVDLGRAVATVLGDSGIQTPSAPRVAVAQRQQGSSLGGSFTTPTDPTNIPLTGRLGYAWITISPDWVGLPDSGVTYRLSATTGPASQLAKTPWARLQPTAILAAAGLSLNAGVTQTVPLVYKALVNGTAVVTKRFSLTFGPTDGSTPGVLAPTAPAVVTGDTIPVTYDITHLSGATTPTLVVSQPGRIDPVTGLYFRPAWSTPLSQPTGTIDVPVSALQGGGIYGIGIQEGPGGWFSANESAYAFVQVSPAGFQQPNPPTLSANGSAPSHFLEIGDGASFQVSYDVRNVSGATGAMLEFSAPGPTAAFENYNPFNNPFGTERDDNGHDTGSTAFLSVPGTHGTVTLTAAQANLVASMQQSVRVLPLHGGAAAGEASGVSAITMDGIVPTDGGNVSNGFGVNSNGTDGYLTSDGGTAAGATLGSIETFSQSTNTITGTATNGDEYNTLGDGNAGLFAGDVGLFEDYNPATNDDHLRILNPVANGTISGNWTPPHSLGGVIGIAENQVTNKTAIIAGTGGPSPTLQVLTSNIAANTFSKPVSLLPGLQGIAFVSPGGIAQDTKQNMVIAAVNDGSNPNLLSNLVTANLTTGAVQGYQGVTTGFPYAVAVDSSTGTAVVGSYEGFGVYNDSTGSGSLVQLGGATYEHPTVDPTQHEFVMQEVSGPDFSTQTPDNNGTSHIIVTDESGNLIERIGGFNFFNIFLANAGDYVQLDPATHTGYTLGVRGAQLHPFTY